MGPFVERAIARVPVVETVGIRTFFCGPESFTPDLAPAVGEAPGIHGYFVCAGLNSVGVLSAGGLGRVVAQWMADGRPDVDVTGFDVARFRDWQLDPRHRAERTAEILGTVYAAHTPGVELASARGEFRSPVHDRLVAEGARLRDVSGWESADWYAGRGQDADRASRAGGTSRGSRTGRPSTGRCARPWASWTCRSWRSSSVRGPDAGAVLDRLSAGAVNAADGVITYTQWLDDDGGILADLTVTRLAADDFLVVASDTAHGRALGLLRRAVGDAAVDRRGRHRPTSRCSPCRARRRAPRWPPRPPTSTGRREAFPFRAARRVDARRGRRARHPDHLPRRARLGALRPGRAHRRGLGRGARGG